MKRELVASALLLLLALGSWWNIRRVDSLTYELESRLEESENAAAQQRFDDAASYAEGALALWLESDGYTHIFIRHSEIDGASDAFYELTELIYQRDGDGLPSAYAKLKYHLDSIASMEHISLGSVF